MENLNEKLEQSEELFRQLAENIQEVFWVCNPELTQMIYISPKYADIWGRSCESLYKDPMSFMEGIHPEDRESVTKALAKWAEVPYDVKYRVIHPDGTLRKIRARGFAVRDKSGSVTRIVGIAEDITELEKTVEALKKEILERKKGEEKLRTSVRQMQEIIDGSSAVIFVKDLEGKYLLINSLYEKLFHVSKEKVLGKTDYDVFPKEAADAFRKADQKALNENRAVQVEESVPHDDGLHYYISSKFPLYTIENKPYAVCGIATDITERKKADTELKKRLQELEVFHKAGVDRELKMVELKKEIDRLEARLKVKND